MKAGDRYKFLYPDDESYTLLIYKVEEIDLGSYECCAKNKGGKASQSAELIITGKCSFSLHIYVCKHARQETCTH